MSLCKLDKEFSVDEAAFWHTNMDLYFGYEVGELVEVEHEPHKYWLAEIAYCYKNLVLLKWVCNYGELWVDTTQSTNHQFSSNMPTKRLFPPGYFLQQQLKSQYKLECPKIAPAEKSLYDPTKDPYANIKTVEDLVKFEDASIRDKLVDSRSGSLKSSTENLLISNCKALVSFRKEDDEELEAALESITDFDGYAAEEMDITKKSASKRENNQGQPETNSNQVSVNTSLPTEEVIDNECEKERATDDLLSIKGDGLDISNGNNSESKSCSNLSISIAKHPEPPTIKTNNSSVVIYQQSSSAQTTIIVSSKDTQLEDSTSYEDIVKKKSSNESPVPQFNHKVQTLENDCSDYSMDDESRLKLCKEIQENAINNLKDMRKSKLFQMKPKQIFDLGGINYERVFIPGTILKIQHSCSINDRDNQDLELYNWFAVILGNIGGRLILQWYLCDEPKFKQGRIELKTFKSKFIFDSEYSESTDCSPDQVGSPKSSDKKVSAKDLIFRLHYCSPKISTFNDVQQQENNEKLCLRLPQILTDSLNVFLSPDEITTITNKAMQQIIDPHRMNLDKDRSIIDHILSKIQSRNPNYLCIGNQFQDNCDFSSKSKDVSSNVIETTVDCDVENNPCKKAIDKSISEDVWISEPKKTRIIPGRIKKIHSQGVIQVHTCESGGDENDEKSLLKFVYPYDDWYGVLPKSWSLPNSECISSSFKKECIDNGCDEVLQTESMIKLRDHSDITRHFRIMDQLEIVHPSSDITICTGRIRRITLPLLWIQLSRDSFTVLPYNSTDLYPMGWCAQNNHELINLLPALKYPPANTVDKKRKRPRNEDSDTESAIVDDESDDIKARRAYYEKQIFDVQNLSDNLSRLNTNYLLTEKSNYTRIYFNHKCFTGPALSKGKICLLPQYVGPGPMRFVMEEVVSKVISMAYVPPRILNDLSSQAFEELLISHNITNTVPMEFKAKYHKRVYREELQVIIDPDDIQAYCECLCEHLKCCYNLFGPNLYDGDFCPNHCRSLTKSNKFMKKATYYREKARLGEYNNTETGKKQSKNKNDSNVKNEEDDDVGNEKTVVDVKDSNSNQLQKEVAEKKDQTQLSTLEEKENKDDLGIPADDILNENFSKNQENHKDKNKYNNGEIKTTNDTSSNISNSSTSNSCSSSINVSGSESDNVKTSTTKSILKKKEVSFESTLNIDSRVLHAYSAEELSSLLISRNLAKFAPFFIEQDIDGSALMLLDREVLQDYFLHSTTLNAYTSADVDELCKFVDCALSKSSNKKIKLEE